ncbi:MAG: T9SS type A sorting domain-containing protein, partial [bacterium]|nr:T9SS type A sorting domain-containing protein [bacterium]
TTSAGSCANNYVLTWEWIATDDAGNADTCTQIITVLDTTAPAFDQACPTNTSVECDAVPTAPTLTATDACGTATVVFSESSTPGACDGNYTITRQWVATDDCGNADTCTQVITVQDNSAPTFDQACPTDLVVECDAVPTAPTLTATDICGTAAVVFSESTTPGACDGEYTITRQWVATDDCGNADTCTQVITVQDSTDPVCLLPNDTTIFLCDLGTVCLPVSATDNCDSDVLCQISSGPGSMISGEWCYDATSSGSVVVDFICTDDCGNSCLKSVTINLVVNTAPVLTISAPTAIQVCSVGESVCADLTVVDPGNGISGSADFGTVDLGAGTVCFDADTAGLYCNTVIVSDTCGLADTASYCIAVSICDPITIEAGQAIDLGLLCDSATGCLTAPAVTACGPNVTWTVNSLPYSPDTTICYTINAASGNLAYQYIVTDSCGRADTATTTVVATINQPPTVGWNPPTTATMCPGDTLCFGIGGIEDPDNNIVEYNLLSAPPGSYLTSGFIYCAVGGYSGMATIIFEVVDACGASSVDTFTYEQITREPVDIPDESYDFFFCSSTTVTLAAPAEVAWPFDSIYYNGAFFASDSFDVVISGSGSSQHLFELFHFCDFVDTAIVTVNAAVNSAPVLTVDAPDSVSLCDTSNSICIPYAVVDPDNGLTVTSLIGTVNETLETICFDVDSTGLYCDRVIVTDSCGTADTVDYCIRAVLDPACFCPTITLEKTHSTYQGHYETVTIFMEDLAFGMGGFDLLIAYDPSALSFVGAEPGTMLTDCGWEYFTYRFGENSNCGTNACPTGVLRVTALAETSNGPNHPDCFGLFSGEIAYLTFLVTNDRNFECQYVPVQFIWYDCGDNTISSVEGDTLFISGDVYSFEGSVITDLGAPFPSYFGANSTCDIALGDGKPDPIRCVDFVNGGIDIVCADSIDAVGDINLNEFPYEIADAVLFSNYFVYGIGVFTINYEGQVAASDINKDGIVLSVADLVYLTKVIVGDALAYSKETPEALTYRYDGSQLTFNAEAAAVALTVRGNQTPLLTVNDMEMKYAYDMEADLTHILVYSMQSGPTVNGTFLEVGGELVSIEASTSQGSVVKLTDLPVEFGLDQNYPNPFNPITTISFTLPKASGYELSIYNISGQVVAQFSGKSNAGHVAVDWDATDKASGIYFYRLRAGGQTAVKKMILLK